MRVALSVSVIQRGKSGVATYVFGLLDGFRRIGVDFELLLVGLEGDREHFGRWLDWAEWLPVSEAHRPAVKNVLWHQTALRGVLAKRRIDVVHIPSYRRILACPPCSQVVTIHDCAAFAVEAKYDLARMIYGRHVVKWLARGADAIVSVSGATADDIARHFGISRDAIHVVWNGLDHERFRPVEAGLVLEALGRLGVASPYFIYLARLEHPAKNHVRLIGAFERFVGRTGAPHRLVLGGADWHGADAIHARIRESPCRERILSLGFVDGGDLPALYAGADAMVYPSLFEGFGLPPVEAMACGCPVVSSTSGSLGEVVGGAARVVDPESEESIAEALGEMAEGGRREDMRRAGFERAALFCWENAARCTLDVYRSLFERS